MTDWPVKTLGEVCEVSRGTSITRKETSPGNVPVVAGGVDIAYFHSVQNRPAGCITISSSGANAGYVNRWDMPIFASDCSTVVARDNGVVLGDYVFRFLQFKQGFINSELRRGAAQPHVYAKDIAAMDLSVPPLEEQKRIVELLDGATSRVIELRDVWMRRSNLETEIRSAFIDELLTPGAGWVERSLSEWCIDIDTGPFGSLVHKADYAETGIPLINPMNIKDGRIIESGIKRVSPSKALELKQHVVQTGDIVLGRRGEMGRCAVVRSEQNGWICGTGSFVLRPSEECNPDLVALWISSRKGRIALGEISSGTTMDNLGNRELGLLRVSFPDRSTQDGLVARALAFEELAAEMEVQQLQRSKQFLPCLQLNL